MLSDFANLSTRGINDSIDSRFAIVCWFRSERCTEFGGINMSYVIMLQYGRETPGHRLEGSERIGRFLDYIDDESRRGV